MAYNKEEIIEKLNLNINLLDTKLLYDGDNNVTRKVTVEIEYCPEIKQDLNDPGYNSWAESIAKIHMSTELMNTVVIKAAQIEYEEKQNDNIRKC